MWKQLCWLIFVIFSGFFDNIINVFIATLDQFNVPLLKKNMNFSQKMLLTTNFWKVVYVLNFEEVLVYLLLYCGCDLLVVHA